MSTTKQFAMRLAPHERHQIEQLAEVRGTNMKKAVLDAVRRQLEEEHDAEPEGGLLARASHLRGSTSGPRDLSSNAAHLDDLGR